MGKTYTSLQVRKIIVAQHEEGLGYKRISKNLGIPRSTIQDVVKKFKERGTVENADIPGKFDIILQFI